MNKNTRQRLKAYRKQYKKSGGWPTLGFKKKKKPFPKLNQKPSLKGYVPI